MRQMLKTSHQTKESQSVKITERIISVREIQESQK